jgi:hypothetical protein
MNILDQFIAPIGRQSGEINQKISRLNRCRRLAMDWENLNRNALAFLKLASVRSHAAKALQPLTKF